MQTICSCGAIFDSSSRLERHLSQRKHAACYDFVLSRLQSDDHSITLHVDRQVPLESANEEASSCEIDPKFLSALRQHDHRSDPVQPELLAPCLEEEASQAEAEDVRLHEDQGIFQELYANPRRVRPFPRPAATIHSVDGQSRYTEWRERCQGNPYHPFRSEIDLHFGTWLKSESISNAAIDRLLVTGIVDALGLSFKTARELNDKVDNQLPSDSLPWTRSEFMLVGTDTNCVLWHRDILEAVKALYGDPRFSDDLRFAPEQWFADDGEDNRIFEEMWTGNWWWRTQQALPDGATVIPLIFSTDKTLLTQMSGDRYGYPIYMSIGNLPKSVRRAPSQRAMILVGYLPTEKLEDLGLSDEDARTARQRMIHECLAHILEPTIEAATNGILLTSGDGCVRRCYPILAAWMADYPEQCLITCTRSRRCPICTIDWRGMGDELRGDEDACDDVYRYPWKLRDQATTLKALTGLVKTHPIVDASFATYPVLPGKSRPALSTVHLPVPDCIQPAVPGMEDHEPPQARDNDEAGSSDEDDDSSDDDPLETAPPPASLPLEIPWHESTHTRTGGLRSYKVFVKALSLMPIRKPFWANLPHAQIHTSMYPDILHQLLQGMLKHLIEWLKDIAGPEELDRGFKEVPATHGARRFLHGLKDLQQLMGQERKAIARVLLGVVSSSSKIKKAGPSGRRVITATRALLDFLYLASLERHSERTVLLLRESLLLFHRNKVGFIELGARKGRDEENLFCIPKLHSLIHYAWAIYEAGSLDNWTTEISERLHIDFAKVPFRQSSGKKDSTTKEMALWVARRERLLNFRSFVVWNLGTRPESQQPTRSARSRLPSSHELSKYPEFSAVALSDLVDTAGWGCTNFSVALLSFIKEHGYGRPEITPIPSIDFLVQSVRVWVKCKFFTPSLKGVDRTHASIVSCCRLRSRNERRARAGRQARFDTVLVGTGKENSFDICTLRVARLKLIFSLSPIANQSLTGQPTLRPLAYVEWFTPPTHPSQEPSGLSTVSPDIDENGVQTASVIDLRWIRRNCMLQPVVLAQDAQADKVERVYFVNSFLDSESFTMAESRW